MHAVPEQSKKQGAGFGSYTIRLQAAGSCRSAGRGWPALPGKGAKVPCFTDARVYLPWSMVL